MRDSSNDLDRNTLNENVLSEYNTIYSKEPLVSLIVGTLGRTEELERLFNSFVVQKYQNFEVILVDQNKDDRLCDIVKHFSKLFSIIHIPSEKGFAYAKNKGIVHSSGDILSFPDDDCWYDPTVLEYVVSQFKSDASLDILLGKTVDENNKTVLSKYDNDSGLTNRENVWFRVGSQTVFMHRRVIRSIGLNDENLGVGAPTPWQSCEDTDHVIRAIDAGRKVIYHANFIIRHPDNLDFKDVTIIRRGLVYSRGYGYTIRKNNYSILTLIKRIYKPMIGVIIFTILGRFIRARYYKNVCIGAIEGWYSYARTNQLKNIKNAKSNNNG